MTYTPNVTCADYREGQRLLALRRQLAQPELPAAEKRRLEAEIAELEQALGLD
ncbi:MAG: hypothetical protein KQJ78_02195 [Deltaproteobacteria bacterium]|nr:hypothetical protein [Deltaproteobacteria bacterium]